MNINDNKPSIHYQGRELEHFDAMIPRIGASHHLLRLRGGAPVRDDGLSIPE
jgi:hypothetical protein